MKEGSLCSYKNLEKKGMVNPYGVEHLNLWTNQISEGKSVRAGEEPQLKTTLIKFEYLYKYLYNNVEYG